MVTGDAVDPSDVDVWWLLHRYGFVVLDWVPPPRRRRNPVLTAIRGLSRIVRGTV
jgi:hypothetical protein